MYDQVYRVSPSSGDERATVSATTTRSTLWNGQKPIEPQRAAVEFNKEISTGSREPTMEADVIIGQKGASAEQIFEDHSSATGTDIQLFGQNSSSSLYPALAERSHHGYAHASTLPPPR